MPPREQSDPRMTGTTLAKIKHIVALVSQLAGPMPPASMAFIAALVERQLICSRDEQWRHNLQATCRVT